MQRQRHLWRPRGRKLCKEGAGGLLEIRPRIPAPVSDLEGPLMVLAVGTTAEISLLTKLDERAASPCCNVRADDKH